MTGTCLPRSAVAALTLLLVSPAARAFTVAIDPGHGGTRDGAYSPWGVKEKNIALAVSKKLQALLEQEKDVKVVLTRSVDEHVELQDRTKLANQAKADMLLSIHCNSMPTKVSRKETMGIETYFLSADATDARAQALAELENADVSQDNAPVAADPISTILQDLSRTEAHADSKRLAEQVHETIVKRLGAKNRGVRQAPFIVLLGAEMPAALVEIGFISNPVEGRKLALPAYQDKVAESLRDAIVLFRDTVFARRAAPEPAGAVTAVAVTPPAVTPAIAVPVPAPVVDAPPPTPAGLAATPPSAASPTTPAAVAAPPVEPIAAPP